MDIYLVRHGQSTGNNQGRLIGWSDHPLTDLGRAQAQRLAARLVGTRFAALYASDLSRAVATAAALTAQGAPPARLDPQLREIDSGAWSGLSDAQVRERFPDEWRRWHEERDPHLHRGGRESYDQAATRMLDALCAIARRHPGGTVAVISHGGVIRAAVARMMGLDLRRIWTLSIANASITRIRPFAPITARADGPCGRALTINDTAHLEAS